MERRCRLRKRRCRARFDDFVFHIKLEGDDSRLVHLNEIAGLGVDPLLVNDSLDRDVDQPSQHDRDYEDERHRRAET